MPSERDILAHIARQPNRAAGYKQLVRELGLRGGEERRHLDERLEKLVNRGELVSTGRDRFVADLRPLVDPAAFACHPYDLCTTMLLGEAGGVVTDPWGDPLDAPLDTTSPVAWVDPVSAASSR